MKAPFFTLLTLSLLTGRPAFCQQYKPAIEPYPNLVKADPRLILQTGYLVVPENRQQPNGRKIKVPFFFVRRPDQDPRKNVSLYTTGGPGYSTTTNIDSISYNSGFLKYGGFIAFDQRGTKRAHPCLDCMEVYEAIKQSYREGKDKDSLVRTAARKCREKFQKQGVDLSAYNTLESVEDINDLRLALHIDSLNLVGISYSGGLMLSMAQRHPEGVRTLILNSPLPGFAKYEEDGLLNINEALEQVFANCEADSSKVIYGDIRNRFQDYFTRITGRQFSIRYLEKGKKDSINIIYTKKELLDAVVNRLNTGQVKTVPFVINELINGHHATYIKEVLDDNFAGNNAISLGMRYSIYCSEQIQHSDPRLEKQQATLLPWLSGYVFNNVDHAICDCWKVRPEPATVKDQIYSAIPALISAGDIDPWCPPFYNRLIKRYMPNSQLLIIHDRGHGAGFTVDGVDYLEMFMKNPLNKIVSRSKQLTVQ